MRRRTRWFCIGTGTLVALGATVTARSIGAQDLSTTKTLYTVADSHLDSDWLWTVKTTIDQYLPPTMRDNFARFEKYPNYVFNFEGAIRYMWMKEYYPADYAKLKTYVASGRWSIAAMSIDAADVNIPSPESLIRHALYASRFYQAEFGKTAGHDIFLPDCFGFGHALPTVATHCGILGFSTNKLSWGGVTIPFDIGTWKGPDGSSIVAALRPDKYDSDFTGLTDGSYDSAAQIQDLGSKYGVWAAYRYYGPMSDRGGAPKEASVAAVESAISSSPSGIKVLSAKSDQLYHDLTAAQKAALPTYNGELVMTTHGTGCYTSHAEVKWGNEQDEVYADAAERAAVIASWLGGATYPTGVLNDAWIRFLWHHHHDDFTGTSIQEVYPTTFNDQMLSRNQFAGVLSHAVGAAARALDTRAYGVPVVVYNPLALGREDVVEAHLAYPDGAPTSVRVFDPEGTEVASQVLSASGNKLDLAFLAKFDALGFGVYDVRTDSTASSIANDLTVNATGLENAKYRIKIDANGDISSIFDKAVVRELLKAPIQLQMLTNTAGSWPAWEVSYGAVGGTPRSGSAGTPSVKIVERGPARAGLEVTRTREDSTITQTLRLASSGASDRLEIESVIDWKSLKTLLKASFPLTVQNPKAVYDLGVGTISRGNNTSRLYEVPAQRWADLAAEDGSYGVSVLSAGKYGWDKPSNDSLRLTLIHTPDPTGSSYGWQGNNEIGKHRIRYGVYGHAGQWSAASTVSQAARMEHALLAFQTTRHLGTAGKRIAFGASSNPAVAIRALKKAEQTAEVIVRLQETSGSPKTGVHIKLGAPITAARQVNGIEDEVGKATVDAGELVVDMAAYEPRTFALTVAAPSAPLSLPVSQPVTLAFDSDVVSAESAKTDGKMDDAGNTIPAELFPASVTSGDITFSLGSGANGAKNALRCKGQKIALPQGDFNRLYLLMTAEGASRTISLGLDQKTQDVLVQDWRMPIGDLGQTPGGNEHPEGIERTEVAWVSTHLHSPTSAKATETYNFAYVFKYGFVLPAGTKELILPNTTDSSHAVILAAAVAKTDDDEVRPAATEYPIIATLDRIPAIAGPTPDEGGDAGVVQPDGGAAGSAGSAGNTGAGGNAAAAEAGLFGAGGSSGASGSGVGASGSAGQAGATTAAGGAIGAGDSPSEQASSCACSAAGRSGGGAANLAAAAVALAAMFGRRPRRRPR
jgi:alpha-mannosidase